MMITEEELIAKLRRKLKREPTGAELDAEIARLGLFASQHAAKPPPYVCHCGRPDCTIDAENE